MAKSRRRVMPRTSGRASATANFRSSCRANKLRILSNLKLSLRQPTVRRRNTRPARCLGAERTGGLRSDGGGFFLDVPRALRTTLFDKLNLYKLRAKVLIEDLAEVLGVLAVWDGTSAAKYGLSYVDPRLPALGVRLMIPPHREADAAREIGANLVAADDYEAHRIALGVPSGGVDFAYGDAFPHEADMDQLGGVDFAKGCYVGQEVV